MEPRPFREPRHEFVLQREHEDRVDKLVETRQPPLEELEKGREHLVDERDPVPPPQHLHLLARPPWELPELPERLLHQRCDPVMDVPV